jgi:ankyrin repeat protein
MDHSAARLVLKTLPRDLNETYDRILRNIPHTRAPNAIKLLQLLITSRRPMLLEEVVDAVATEPDVEPPFALENRVNPPEAIVDYCPSLVRITTTYVIRYTKPVVEVNHGYNDSDEDGDDTDDPGQHKENEEDKEREEYEEPTAKKCVVRVTIQLAHSSVQEYLLLDRRENPYHGSFLPRVANATITRISLAYLWTAAQASDAQLGATRFSLVDYAAQNWLEHARIAGDSEESTFTWTKKILTNVKFMWYWWKIYEAGEIGYCLLTLPLHYASLSGLCRSVEHLLEAGADVNGTGNRYGNALQAACSSGSIETVQMLIDHGADLSPKNRICTSLHVAAATGDVKIMHVLLENGADVNATDGDSKTALYQACQDGQVEMVRMLLGHGADVNLGGIYGTALQEACAVPTSTTSPQGLESRYATIVRILLDHGADVNGHLRGSRPALSLACASGRPEIVQMLIDRGADVNERDEFWGTVICVAAHHGHKDTIRILLDRGADANARRGTHSQFECALLSACRPKSGYIDRELVQLLLDSGADPNTKGIGRSNALRIASNAEVVEMLMQAGATMDTFDRTEGATFHTPDPILKAYGQTYSEFDAQELYDYMLLLTCDPTEGRIYRERVQQLLDYGADPNATDPDGKHGNALCAASGASETEVVEILIKAGADVNAKGGIYGYALLSACRPSRCGEEIWVGLAWLDASTRLCLPYCH